MNRFSASLGRWYDHPRAPLVAYLTVVLLAVAGMASFAYTLDRFEEQQQRDADTRAAIVETQQTINTEQRDRTVAVCDALVESKDDLRRALETLIAVSADEGESDPERARRVELFRREAIRPLETPPPQCDEIREPLPEQLPVDGGD